jgi:stage V sporulation protein AC
MFERKKVLPPRETQKQAEYQRLVERMSPGSRMGQGLIRSYWVGGVVCMLAQGIADLFRIFGGVPDVLAGTLGSIGIVALTAILTGMGTFDKIGQYAGAGAFVPISGFANSMVSAAMEFRREGLILGLGAKLFSIAGPVLVYGISASVVVGIVYALFPWG